MFSSGLLLFFVVRSLSHVRLSVTPWTAARQASLSFTISWSSFKFMSIMFYHDDRFLNCES